LLGSGGSNPPVVRTFGAAAAPKGEETNETRPLDGGGLMHLQQTKMNDQDSMLTQLSVRSSLSLPSPFSFRDLYDLYLMPFFGFFRPFSFARRKSLAPSARRSLSRTSCSTGLTPRSTIRVRSWVKPRGPWSVPLLRLCLRPGSSRSFFVLVEPPQLVQPPPPDPLSFDSCSIFTPRYALSMNFPSAS
jgi:hypothetical protein